MENVLIVIILICGFLPAAVGKLQGSKRPMLLNPVFIFSVTWLVGLVIIQLPIFVHREKLTLLHVLYIGAAFAALSVGSVIGLLANNQAGQKPLAWSGLVYKPMFLYALFLLGLFGNFAVALDAHLSGGLSIADRLSGGLEEVRQMQMKSVEQEVGGPLFRFETLAPMSLVLCVIWLTSRRELYTPGQRRALTWASWFSLLPVLFNAVFVKGGRIDIVLALLVLGFALLFEPNRKLLKRALGGSVMGRVLKWGGLSLVGAAAVTLASVVWVQMRSSSVHQADIAQQLYLSHRTEFTTHAYQIARHNPALGYGLFTLSYFTVPIPTLTVYLDMDERLPGPFFGRYNFDFTVRQIEKPFIDYWDRRTWMSIRWDIFEPLMRLGYGYNVWATMLRDLMVDFGRIGALLFLAFAGFISQVLVNRAGRGDQACAVLGCYVFTILLFSGFHSLLFITIVGHPTVIGIWFLVLRSLNPRWFFVTPAELLPRKPRRHSGVPRAAQPVQARA